MSGDYLFSLALVMGAISLWLVVMTALGGLNGLWRKLRRSPLQKIQIGTSGGDDEVGSEQDWPLSARLAKSFQRLGKNTPRDPDLMVRLFQAGLPYYSPAHYYSRQVSFALLFAAFGLVNAAAVALVVHLPSLLVILAALVLGIWGAAQPGLEVSAKIRRRSRELAIDMTYQLPRLILLLEAYGSAQEAISAYLATASRRDLPEKERREAERQARTLSKEFAMELGVAMQGMGGNLFAELLNRIASELTRSVRMEEITAHVRRIYPPTLEMNHFLDILTAGVEEGFPMKERLAELSAQLRQDLRARSREAAQAANQVVILAAAAELLPIFAVVGAPVIFLALRMFQ